MSGNERSTVRRLADLLSTDENIDLAIVFGSIARGEPRADSDVDIAVLTRTPMDAERKQALAASIAVVTGRPVDLVDLRTAGVHLTSVVLHTGKRLVCREPRIWADLLAKNLVDAADFLPYRERIMTERRQTWIP